jgi:DNA polymerase-3 subunit delta
LPEVSYAAVTKGSFPDPLARVYLVVGADDALKHEAVGRILTAALDPAFADFDREAIDLGAGGDGMDGSEDPVVKILSAAGAAPFMSPKRVVQVSSIQRLPKERQEALADGISHLGELSCLILVADAQEFEGGKPKGKQVENALRKAAAAHGIMLTCDSPEAKDLRTRVADMIAAAGKTAELEVIEALVARAAMASGSTGGDLNTLINETEKMITYVGDAPEITLHDTRALIATHAEENIFALLDAVGNRDAKAALSKTDALLDGDEKADSVAARTFVMLQRHFRLMALAKYLGEQHVPPRGALPSAVKDVLSGELAGFAAGQGYRLQSYGKQATRFSWRDIQQASSRILLSDMMMKGIVPGESLGVKAASVGDDPATNLRLLVMELCRLGK